MLTARAFCIARRSARLDSGSGPPALTAIVISLPMRANCFEMRSQRANIVCLRVSKMRPMAGSGAGAYRKARLNVDQTDAHRRALRGRIDELPVAIAGLELLPEAMHLGRGLVGLRNDVVERDQAAGPDQAGVVLEIPLHAVVGVVAVQEEEVQRLSLQPPRQLGAQPGLVRVAA